MEVSSREKTRSSYQFWHSFFKKNTKTWIENSNVSKWIQNESKIGISCRKYFNWLVTFIFIQIFSGLSRPSNFDIVHPDTKRDARIWERTACCLLVFVLVLVPHSSPTLRTLSGWMTRLKAGHSEWCLNLERLSNSSKPHFAHANTPKGNGVRRSNQVVPPFLHSSIPPFLLRHSFSCSLSRGPSASRQRDGAFGTISMTSFASILSDVTSTWHAVSLRASMIAFRGRQSFNQRHHYNNERLVIEAEIFNNNNKKKQRNPSKRPHLDWRDLGRSLPWACACRTPCLISATSSDDLKSERSTFALENFASGQGRNALAESESRDTSLTDTGHVIFYWGLATFLSRKPGPAMGKITFQTFIQPLQFLHEQIERRKSNDVDFFSDIFAIPHQRKYKETFLC